MKPNADAQLHQQHVENLIKSNSKMKKLKRDPRVIPIIGTFLRKTSLDELPQLINVLKGEMSIVGPRPCLPYEAKYYDDERFKVLPGITGLWQVSGKNETTFDEMLKLDLQYVNRQSILFDCTIMLKTIPTVVANAIRR